MDQHKNPSPSFINIGVLLLFAIVIAGASAATTYYFLSSKTNEQPSITQPLVVSSVQTNVLPTIPPATQITVPVDQTEKRSISGIPSKFSLGKGETAVYKDLNIRLDELYAKFTEENLYTEKFVRVTISQTSCGDVHPGCLGGPLLQSRQYEIFNKGNITTGGITLTLIDVKITSADFSITTAPGGV